MPRKLFHPTLPCLLAVDIRITAHERIQRTIGVREIKSWGEFADLNILRGPSSKPSDRDIKPSGSLHVQSYQALPQSHWPPAPIMHTIHSLKAIISLFACLATPSPIFILACPRICSSRSSQTSPRLFRNDSSASHDPAKTKTGGRRSLLLPRQSRRTRRHTLIFHLQ